MTNETPSVVISEREVEEIIKKSKKKFEKMLKVGFILYAVILFVTETLMGHPFARASEIASMSIALAFVMMSAMYTIPLIVNFFRMLPWIEELWNKLKIDKESSKKLIAPALTITITLVAILFMVKISNPQSTNLGWLRTLFEMVGAMLFSYLSVYYYNVTVLVLSKLKEVSK